MGVLTGLAVLWSLAIGLTPLTLTGPAVWLTALSGMVAAYLPRTLGPRIRPSGSSRDSRVSPVPSSRSAVWTPRGSAAETLATVLVAAIEGDVLSFGVKCQEVGVESQA
jgi:hypothetical protein